MLKGIDPLLTGTILHHLSDMGHSDAVVIVDAHFPARRVGRHVVDVPSADATTMTTAVLSVLPLDDDGVDLMATITGDAAEIYDDLIEAAGGIAPAYIERWAFYERAAAASLVIRTGETRTYGNIILRKGLVEPTTP